MTAEHILFGGGGGIFKEVNFVTYSFWLFSKLIKQRNFWNLMAVEWQYFPSSESGIFRVYLHPIKAAFIIYTTGGGGQGIFFKPAKFLRSPSYKTFF